MELAHARYLAETAVKKLMPGCRRIKIAGSIRRHKAEPKDLDLVVLPKRNPIKDLFGTITSYIPCQEFRDQVDSWEKLKGEATGKYTQRLFEGVKLELSIAEESNFGALTLIRTGNHEFNIIIMNRVRKCGLEQRDGHLYKGEKLIPIREEEDYFKILDLPFIEPRFRDEHAFRRLNQPTI